MVKELVGNGELYRDFFQSSGGDLSTHSRILFVEGEDTDEDQILQKLSEFPCFYDSSFLLRNVKDPYGKRVSVLFVPKETPKLRPSRYVLTDALPKDDETYIVDSWKSGKRGSFEAILVLAENVEQAARFATRRAITKFGPPKSQINTQAMLVSPEDWVKKAKDLIDEDTRLPDLIMRWAGLQAYADARTERNGL